MPFLLLLSLLFVHELGHFICALILKVKVDKICFYPFGGISKFNAKINISLNKELLILIMGPISQAIFYIIMKDFIPNGYLEIFKIYNLNTLLFNLLPVYPLDGGKFINILLSYKFSYKKSLTISLVTSYIVVLVLAVIILPNSFKLNILLLGFLLIFKVTEEYKKRHFYQERFLLERYLNNYRFKRYKEVQDTDQFKRDTTHLMKRGARYYTEREILERKFKK